MTFISIHFRHLTVRTSTHRATTPPGAIAGAFKALCVWHTFFVGVVCGTCGLGVRTSRVPVIHSIPQTGVGGLGTWGLETINMKNSTVLGPLRPWVKTPLPRTACGGALPPGVYRVLRTLLTYSKGVRVSIATLAQHELRQLLHDQVIPACVRTRESRDAHNKGGAARVWSRI